MFRNAFRTKSWFLRSSYIFFAFRRFPGTPYEFFSRSGVPPVPEPDLFSNFAFRRFRNRFFFRVPRSARSGSFLKFWFRRSGRSEYFWEYGFRRSGRSEYFENMGSGVPEPERVPFRPGSGSENIPGLKLIEKITWARAYLWTIVYGKKAMNYS